MPNPTLPVGQAYPMPVAEGFTMAVFKSSDTPAGTNLYTLPPMDEDADIYLIARVFAQFREDACIQGNDRVDGAFIKAARVLMGAAEAGPFTTLETMRLLEQSNAALSRENLRIKRELIAANAQAADIPDTLLVDLFYAANGDISKFRIKARALLTANGAKP